MSRAEQIGEDVTAPAGRRLRHGDIVAVMRSSTGGEMVGQIDVIHWDTDPVWLSLIDVDTGERDSAQLRHMFGRLENDDPAPRPSPEPPPAPLRPDDPPGIGVVYAD